MTLSVNINPCEKKYYQENKFQASNLEFYSPLGNRLNISLGNETQIIPVLWKECHLFYQTTYDPLADPYFEVRD